LKRRRGEAGEGAGGEDAMLRCRVGEGPGMTDRR
jgi:hypothetical protein